MSKIVAITPILEAQKTVIDAQRIAEKILQEDEQWRKFTKFELERWLKEGNGRQSDSFDPPRK